MLVVVFYNLTKSSFHLELGKPRVLKFLLKAEIVHRKCSVTKEFVQTCFSAESYLLLTICPPVCHCLPKVPLSPSS